MKKLLQILKNPFEISSDKSLTTTGIILFTIGITLAYFFQIQLQILRVNPLVKLTITDIIIGHLIVLSALTIVYFILGKIINRKTRLLDILNTILISIAPLYLIFFENINGYMYNEIYQMEEAIKSGGMLNIKTSIFSVIISVISISITIYFIYLLFIGFKTATNAKKIWHYVLFFVILFITDLICSGLINSI
ncbi:MAG: hypothetical protein Q4G18_08480 [Myroides sp.]|nr:hypothetical protein [Myroides sp.]